MHAEASGGNGRRVWEFHNRYATTIHAGERAHTHTHTPHASFEPCACLIRMRCANAGVRGEMIPTAPHPAAPPTIRYFYSDASPFPAPQKSSLPATLSPFPDPPPPSFLRPPAAQPSPAHHLARPHPYPPPPVNSCVPSSAVSPVPPLSPSHTPCSPSPPPLLPLLTPPAALPPHQSTPAWPSWADSPRSPPSTAASAAPRCPRPSCRPMQSRASRVASSLDSRPRQWHENRRCTMPPAEPRPSSRCGRGW